MSKHIKQCLSAVICVCQCYNTFNCTYVFMKKCYNSDKKYLFNYKSD